MPSTSRYSCRSTRNPFGESNSVRQSSISLTRHRYGLIATPKFFPYPKLDSVNSESTFLGMS